METRSNETFKEHQALFMKVGQCTRLLKEGSTNHDQLRRSARRHNIILLVKTPATNLPTIHVDKTRTITPTRSETNTSATCVATPSRLRVSASTTGNTGIPDELTGQARLKSQPKPSDNYNNEKKSTNSTVTQRQHMHIQDQPTPTTTTYVEDKR